MEFLAKQMEIAHYVTDCLVIGVNEQRELSSAVKNWNKQSQSYLNEIIQQGDMGGKLGQTLLLHRVPLVKSPRVLLVGLGKEKSLSVQQYRKVIDSITKAVGSLKITEITFCMTDVVLEERNVYWNIRFAAQFFAENQYQYTEFLTQPSENSFWQKIIFSVGSVADLALAESAIMHAHAINIGVQSAKDLANCPANVCNPFYLANKAKQLAEKYTHINTTIVDEELMAELGMNAYLAVSSGADNRAYLSVMEYRNHPDKQAKPIVLIGKGLTFDAGGISIKPAAAMDEMKYDMCGAASIYGVMQAIAELNLPLNVVGLMAGCENLIGSKSYRPGDILTTMSGLTVEVLNTDAEGRLVLCDTLTYAKRFEAEQVIDVATLTGACMVALGTVNTGLMSTNDHLAKELSVAANQTQDKVWRLPLDEEYEPQLKSNFADLANVGGRFAGAITAGLFLSHFAKYSPWAHLDIAGTAWKSGSEKGATGRPVDLLVQYLLNKVG